MVSVPPYQIYSLNPTVLTDKGPIDLTRLSMLPKQSDVETAFSRIGKTAGRIFPLRFETDIPVPKGPATGEMKGFLHRINYQDDNGWQQHIDYFYQTASELEAAIKSFNDKEAARKAALEPSREEEALLKAVKTQDAAEVRLSLAKGVNLNRGGTFDYEGYTRKNVTPLMLAAETGNLELLEILLKAGAEVGLADDSNEPRKSGRTALAYAYKKHYAATRLLLEAGANPNHRLSFGHTLFDEICYDGKIEMIQLLLSFGADPNSSCGKSDYFALERATSADRLNVVKVLLKNKADINSGDTGGWTALMKASQLLRLKIVQLLLENGAAVTSKTISNVTALHQAVTSAARLDPRYDSDAAERFLVAMQIIKALVAKGADVNAMTKYGDSPLSLAKDCKFPELAKYLNSNRAQ